MFWTYKNKRKRKKINAIIIIFFALNITRLLYFWITAGVKWHFKRFIVFAIKNINLVESMKALLGNSPRTLNVRILIEWTILDYNRKIDVYNMLLKNNNGGRNCFHDSNLPFSWMFSIFSLEFNHLSIRMEQKK